ncbi:MAG: PQQ-binding-like beta-propeller repeat protein [Vicinamibacteria bacterium]
MVGEFVRPPLAADGRRIFVATRDGSLRGLDPATGGVDWKNDSVPGTIAATDGVLLARDETGVVRSVHPRTGVVRWSVETGIAGTLPPRSSTASARTSRATGSPASTPRPDACCGPTARDRASRRPRCAPAAAC